MTVNRIVPLLRRGRSIRFLWSGLASFLVLLGGPRLAAWLTYLSIEWDSGTHNRTVLCLGRDSFVKDIAELRKRTHFNYPIITAGYTRFQKAWTPKERQIQTYHQKESKDQETEFLEKSASYALKLIELVSRKHRVNAVLSANFDYWQDAGFKQACTALGIPFLVLSREHPVIPKVCEKVTDWYRNANYRFDGTAIAVAGRSTKDVVLAAGPICTPEQITITGLPRYDAWLDANTSTPVLERPLVTLLTFSRGYLADETFKEVLELFLKAAKKFREKNVHFLVKCKDPSDTQYVRPLLSGAELPNLSCNHNYDLFEALPNSRLVINYNSLSLLEAVMARAWTVIPAWGQCHASGPAAMYDKENPDVARVVSFADNEDVLLEMIAASIQGEACAPRHSDLENFLRTYIHVPDDRSYSREFEAFLDRYVVDEVVREHSFMPEKRAGNPERAVR